MAIFMPKQPTDLAIAEARRGICLHWNMWSSMVWFLVRGKIIPLKGKPYGVKGDHPFAKSGKNYDQLHYVPVLSPMMNCPVI
jgi:hypothetical protein